MINSLGYISPKENMKFKQFKQKFYNFVQFDEQKNDSYKREETCGVEGKVVFFRS